MNFRRAAAIALSSVAVFVASAPLQKLQAANPLILKYSAEEGLAGRQARGATFKAWIDGGIPVVGQTNEEGKVDLNLGRSLSIGQILYVEAESADGERFYSWVFKDAALSGSIGSTCQLVGIQDFRRPEILTAQRPE